MPSQMASLMPILATCTAVGFFSAEFFFARSSSSCSMNLTRASLDLTSSMVSRVLKQSRLVILVAIVSIPFWFVRFPFLFMYLLYHRFGLLSSTFFQVLQTFLSSLLTSSPLVHSYYTTGLEPCQEFFLSFKTFFKVLGASSPLVHTQYSTSGHTLQQSKCTKSGKIFFSFLFKFSLDNRCTAWYNGNSAQTCATGPPFYHRKRFLSSGKINKKQGKNSPIFLSDFLEASGFHFLDFHFIPEKFFSLKPIQQAHLIGGQRNPLGSAVRPPKHNRLALVLLFGSVVVQMQTVILLNQTQSLNDLTLGTVLLAVGFGENNNPSTAVHNTEIILIALDLVQSAFDSVHKLKAGNVFMTSSHYIISFPLL